MSKYYGGEDIPAGILLLSLGCRLIYVGFDIWGYAIGSLLVLLGGAFIAGRLLVWRNA